VKRVLGTIIGILIGLAAVAGAGIYFLYDPEPEVFPPYTKINNVDVAGLTPDQASAKIAETMSEKPFSFEYEGKYYGVSKESLSYDIPADTVLSKIKLLEQIKSLLHIENTYEIKVTPEENEEFLEQIKKLSFCNNSRKSPSVDAYVDLSDFEFRTVKEVVGNEIDPELVMGIAFKSISEGKSSAHLTEEEIIDMPDITVDSKEFKDRLKYCKDNLSFKLEYEVDGETTVITPDKLDKMVKYTDDGVKFRKKKITAFVEDLASECNEYNESYHFTTHGGSDITVKGVNYGRILSKDGMKEELRSALKAQEDKTLDMKWDQVKYNGNKGIGNSYIEVSISDQHVWCYKDGKVIVDCDCVTGAPGHDTARGVFIVQYVTGPTTLKGENGDGTRYASPVNCFIPFYGGQGFHGSNGWRKEWGGQIYKTAGSHGCVNCPDAAAKKMADNVGSGYPVVIY